MLPRSANFFRIAGSADIKPASGHPRPMPAVVLSVPEMRCLPLF